ncbi:hypothetical protein [Nocardioides mesophilus]|uniref:Uncharacterized protein n=1 Tax=Nocardioides mesophilus TaxID=433659 RepID=A0A7G9R9S2_9ACTN|nr:hypothetical protein [Nocardioides mesophilus]QNN52347.1 hypothetical protein H9L09_17960 [Nocardioides mesophilus]
MNSKLTLRSLGLGLAALAIGATGATGVASGDEVSGSRAAGAPPTAATAALAPMTVEKPVTIEQQRGLVIEATGVLDGEPVGVSLYENQKYGNSVQVFFPETDEVGAVEQSAPFVVDGRLDVTVDVDGRTVVLRGVVTETGTTKVVEPVQDNGEQIISRGTHSELQADLAITVGGLSTPLEASAFGFDLDVRRIQLYGN